MLLRVAGLFIGVAFWVCVPVSAQNIITTVAGSTFSFPGDNGPALGAPVGQIQAAAVDGAGNVYVADVSACLIYKISSSGLLTVVAGNGINGFSGDGGPAVNASLSFPAGVALDPFGNLYISEFGNHRIRRVTPDGAISTYAGNGTGGYSGDGGAATAAALYAPTHLAADVAGNVFLVDHKNNRVRKVSPSGVISTVAGNGTAGFSGDGGLAVNAALKFSLAGLVSGIAVDASGNLYIADSENQRIRKVTTAGVISTYAGVGISGYSGDGGSAAAARFYGPQGLALDTAGNLYVADAYNNRIRKISAVGIISTVAGNGNRAFSGDGGPATAAALGNQSAVTVDATGNLYVVDTLNARIRKVSPGGTISTIAGTGNSKFGGDGGPATSAFLNSALGVSLDAAGNLFVADSLNNRIRKISPSGIITTVAGNGNYVFAGDGDRAVGASMSSPTSVISDAAGNLYICDEPNLRVRRVNTSGIISTYAGNGGDGYSGDGVAARGTSLSHPFGLALDTTGNLYIADRFNHRVRKVSPAGIITTVAGNGTAGFSGDGGQAAAASLQQPTAVTLDASGNLYIAEFANHRVRKVTTAGVISTFAGIGTAGFSGDGGAAAAAALNSPAGLAVSGSGEVFIADLNNNRVRKVQSNGIIVTVAGNGVGGFFGDGGLATSASLNTPLGLAVDGQGNLYIADSGNDRIRKVQVAQPSFSVDVDTLSLTATAGAPAQGSRSFNLASSMAGLAWSATVDVPWLTLSQGAGRTPSTVALSVDGANLEAGTYKGTISILAPGAVPAQAAISLTLAVSAAPSSRISVEPRSLTIEASTGGANPAAKSLRVSNAGGGSIEFDVRVQTNSGGNWLAVSPEPRTAAASAPAQLQILTSTSGLPPGSHTGVITVTAARTQQSATTTVNLVVKQSQLTLLLSQSGMSFTGVEGGGPGPEQTFGVLNIGQGTMSWTAQVRPDPGCGWLRVLGGGGSSVANAADVPLVAVSPDATGLSAGEYTCQVQVDAQGADNTPRLVTVVFDVKPPGTPLPPLIRPASLIFVRQAGTSSPGSQIVRMSTGSSAGVETRISAFTFDPSNWLRTGQSTAIVTPSQPLNIVVQPTLGSLAPGQYFGTVSLLVKDLGTESFSSQNVGVLFVVTPRPGQGTLLRRSGEGEEGCTPAHLFLTLSAVGSAAAVPVGYPTTLETKVKDDCDRPVTAATVIATFSTGEPPLNMVHLGGGTYRGSWRPNSATPQAVVTAQARSGALSGTARLSLQTANAAIAAISAGGIVNAAGFQPGALAPGSIVSVFGQNMALAVGAATVLPLPNSLGGVTLSIGGQDAPLYYSSGGQVNAQIPFETPTGTVQSYLRIVKNGKNVFSDTETLTIVPFKPGIFTTNAGEQGVVVDTRGRLVDASAPAAAGDVLVAYATGLGAVDRPVRSGQPAPSNPPAKTVTGVTVRIGDRTVPAEFAGLTPGLVGLYQINFAVPAGVAPGNAVPLIVTMNGVASNTVTIAVQ